MDLEEAHQYALCLNMIVKDESHIIKNTLTKLLQKINFDYWIISDTGSTDKTKEIITEFFEEVGIPGELYQDEWVDFSHNRSKALEYAFGKSKYLLIFDADDEICGDFVLPELVKDYYQFQFGSQTKYTRTQIVNNHKRWKYVGVLHELICSNDDRIDGASMEVIKGPYYTVSGRSGNRNLDSNKYLKDAIILEKAYYNSVDAKDDIYNRYGFYCANSYYDCDKYENAIIWYKKTLENGGWAQEKYVSCLKLYKCYEKMNNIEAGFFYLVKSAEYDRERAECYYELIKYYSGSGLHNVGYGYYGVLRDFYNNSYLKDGLHDKLFLDESVSEFYLPYYVIIVSEKMRDYETGIQMYRIIFTKKYKCFNEWFIGNLLYNLQFFTEYVKDEDKIAFYHLFQEYVDFLVANNYPLFDETVKIYEKYGIKKKEASVATDDECFTSKKILIYTGFMDYLWNDTYVSNHAIGGAEKAVAYLARNLPKEYEIIISGDVADEVVGNVKYVNRFKLQAILDVEKFHTIIVSRYVSFFLLFPRFNCYQLYLSAHDSTGFLNNFNGVPVGTIIEENNKCIKGVICLTRWHKLNTIETHACLKDKVSTINNGILVAGATSNKKLSHSKIKNKFVWTSCSYRGLDVMLKLWDEILEVMPDATLDISSYDAFPCNKKDEEIQMIINRHSDTVKHHGKLNTLQLHELISKAEYWLYTNTFCETSCITALEMLMHEVVCLYYSLAGLTDTIGEYGIQVNSGNEIQSIMNLSEAKKVEMRINGKKYAMSCSWENRAKEWTSVLGLGLNILKKKKIGIFNSFPFHYEMFGFILNYAKNNNYEVDIFTNQTNTLGWLEFYRETFDNFNIIDFNKFNGRADEYTTFFVTTDDDTKFKSEWVFDNVVCVNHYYKIRTLNFKHYLNVANFKDSTLEYAYPCYPLINHLDKNQNNSICIIGGGNIHHKHNICVINRLQSNGRIKLNIFVRKICNTNISELDINKFDINFIEDGTTSTMIKILKQSSYVLINYNDNQDHNNGISCSGSLQLALSMLCKPIIVDSANKYLQINNVLEYDVNSDEPIIIDNEINFQLLEQERNKYVDKFDKYIKNILSTLKVINNFEYDNVDISLLDNKNLCLLTYGQFRTFKNNFRNNLLELYPVYTVYENVYIFILLDECISQEESVNTKYKENCDYIKNICKEFNIKIGFIQNINNLNYKHEEINYCSKLFLQKSDDKQLPNDFVLNLLYRKYKLIELVEEYCIDHKIDISDILHSRLFDVIIKKNTSVITIINNFKNTDSKKTIYFSPDTIFFGNHNLIKKIMKFENLYKGDELWNNKDFCNFSYKFDSILTNNKDTYAPEIQYTANIYFKSVDAINLRYFKPDPNCLDKNLMYEVMLDHNRGFPTTFDIKKKLLNLNLTREYIVELNNTIDSTYLDYFNESGLNDYKQKIGSEHYKLLCAISSQISNGIIIDIGTHNGNSAIALGYNLYKNKNNIVDRSMLYTFDIKDFKSESFKKFMNNYCVHSSLENIFDYTVREKYKNVLLESQLILIDVDPHNGVLEYELYSWLFENNYEGIILFDDIFLERGHTANNYDTTYQSMKIFWNKIPDKYKLDITHLGHWSGTGLVSFNINKNFINLDSNNIPKKIFQTWETADVEPEFQQIIDKWKYYNPTYEYIFQDAEQRVEFIRNNFEKNVLDAYKKIIPGAYKCDLWRYCILYIYGGFYADIDTLCMGKLDSLTNENIEFIVPIDLNINQKEGQHNLACGFIGSVPKSPILLDAINRIIFNVENNIIPESKLDFSGPGLLGRSVNKFLKLHETNSFKGKEGIQNNINFLEFDANTEYMRDVYTNINILQNKNRNSDIIRLYNNECNKIKNYACWLSDNVIDKNL